MASWHHYIMISLHHDITASWLWPIGIDDMMTSWYNYTMTSYHHGIMISLHHDITASWLWLIGIDDIRTSGHHDIMTSYHHDIITSWDHYIMISLHHDIITSLHHCIMALADCDWWLGLMTVSSSLFYCKFNLIIFKRLTYCRN